MAEQDEALLRAEYERCHPDDTFDAFRQRAAFSKEDRMLLREWRAAIRARTAQAAPS